MTAAQLRPDYVADGRVRLVYNHFPFINDLSETAAEASECAGVVGGADGFWGMVDGIYAQGRGIERQDAADLAGNLGLDVGSWNSCMDAGGARLAWQADKTRGISNGVKSTPTIFVAYIDADGQQRELQFEGGQEYDKFSDLLDSILERAQ